MKIRNTLLAIAIATLGSAAFAPNGKAQVLIYDDTTTFTGFGAKDGGATSGTGSTFELADDLTYNPAFSLTPVSGFKFSIANLNAGAVTIMPTVIFYDSNGSGGGPGTILTGFNFGSISVASGVNTYSVSLTAGQQFSLPSDGTIWAGIFFTGVTGDTTTQLNNFGQGLFTPPTTGTSADRDFLSSVTGPGTSNPAGAIRTSPFGGAPPANYYWQLSTTVPEPASTALFIVGGIGLLVAVQRRRTAK